MFLFLPIYYFSIIDLCFIKTLATCITVYASRPCSPLFLCFHDHFPLHFFSVNRSYASLNLDGLTLSEEGLTLNLESEPETAAVLEHCLITQVFTDRKIQFAYFRERMSRAWKPGKRVTITKYVVDHYLFQFHHRVGVAHVLDEGPWLYDNFHIVMDRFSPGVVPNFVTLNHIEFWVQVHGLPFDFIHPKVGQGIGSFLGTLKAYDGRNTIHSSYM